MTIESVKRALFEGGEYELKASREYNDIGLDWSVKENLDKQRLLEPNDGLFWDGQGSVEGMLWGGCVESLIVQSSTGNYLPSSEDLDKSVLMIETSEDIPEHWIVEYLLTGFGERGWFEKFQAILVGRPKAWEFNKQKSMEEKANYRKEQRETVLKVVREYNATIPVVQNVDFGHTDPQVIMPLGRRVHIDTVTKKILLTY
jgi:muramoyltetrapeptide carboxypeptidase LdcA involved in peptidoglycan recycling